MNKMTPTAVLPSFLTASLVLAGVMTAGLVQAKPFKWSSASDIPTLDIHSQNNALGNGVHAAIFDSLVYYNSKTFKIEPKSGHLLARDVAHTVPLQPSQGRQVQRRLAPHGRRRGVLTGPRPCQGLQLQRLHPGHQPHRQGRCQHGGHHLSGPNPVVLNQMTELRIMSKAWAEKNKSMEPKDIQDQRRKLCPPQRHGQRRLHGQRMAARPKAWCW
jgi:peptide/nickel transport system substrate-binding protein